MAGHKNTVKYDPTSGDPPPDWWHPKYEPFKPGNKAAVTHGAYSKDLVAQKADEVGGETFSRLCQVLEDHRTIEPVQERPTGRRRKPRVMTPLERTVRSVYEAARGSEEE